MVDLQAFVEHQNSTKVVAILNVTPDSFFDGGKYTSTELVLKRAKVCIDEGADVLELGAESTGPGSLDVSTDQEIQRLLPSLRAVRQEYPDVVLSVDTYKAAVAEEAFLAGADSINDVTAGRGDDRMFTVIAKARCGYVMMYSKDETARTTKQAKHYSDVVSHIENFLRMRIEAAIHAGIKKEQIIVDPGLGHFVSAVPQYSFHILDHLQRFAALAPVLVSPSRKSFLAGTQNVPPADRLPATLEATRVAVQNGASFIRTHDVKETVLTIQRVKTLQE